MIIETTKSTYESDVKAKGLMKLESNYYEDKLGNLWICTGGTTKNNKIYLDFREVGAVSFID